MSTLRGSMKGLCSGINRAPVLEIYEKLSQPERPKLSTAPASIVKANLESDNDNASFGTSPRAPNGSNMDYSKLNHQNCSEQYLETASLGDTPEPRVFAVESSSEGRPSLPRESSVLSSHRPRRRDSVTSDGYPTKMMLSPPPPPPPGPRPTQNITSVNPSSNPGQHISFSTAQDNISTNREWEKLKRLRGVVWSLRSQIHESRRVLQERKQIVAAADNAYFSHVRKVEAGLFSAFDSPSTEPQLRAQLFEACSQARDEYGPLEDDLTLLENTLGIHEFSLERLEEPFYSRPTPPPPPPSSFRTSVPSYPSSRSSGKSSIGRPTHPLLSTYLSLLGDISILEERLEWMLEEKESLQAEALTRSRVNLSLAPSDLAWLINFPSAEEALLKELEAIENEKEVVRKQCFEAGLVNEQGDQTDFEEQERHIFQSEVSIEAGSERSGYVKFPIIIPPPAAIREPSVPETTNQRIDEWLLRQLRSSPLEVNLLARTFESMYGKIIKDKWQTDVLNCWYIDSKESKEAQAEQRGSSSEVVTHALRIVEGVARSEPAAIRKDLYFHPSFPHGNLESRDEEPQLIETVEGYQYLRSFPLNSSIKKLSNLQKPPKLAKSL